MYVRTWSSYFIRIFFLCLQSATSPGASNDGLTKQQLELIQQIMQQTQQQQQQQTSAPPQQQRSNSSTTVTAQSQKTQKPSKSVTSSGSVSNNSGSSNATNNARSSPKPKVWSHIQVSYYYQRHSFDFFFQLYSVYIRAHNYLVCGKHYICTTVAKIVSIIKILIIDSFFKFVCQFLFRIKRLASKL